MPLDVELVLVGDEFALGLVPDPPHGEVARRLLAMGLEIAQVTACGSREWAVEAAFRGALERATVVIAFGGLGTRPADTAARVAARVTGRRLVMHETARVSVETKLARRKPRADGTPSVPPKVEKLVLLPQRCELIPNGRGLADGFRIPLTGKHLVCLPASAAEALPMLEADVYPFLEQELTGRIASRLAVLKCFGLPMARVEEAVEAAVEGVTVDPYAVFPEVHVKVLARAAGPGEGGADLDARFEAAVTALRERLGDACFGRDDETLESVVGRLLGARGERLATAESCTGGLLGGRVTAVPGSSAWFERGVVTYSNEAKTDLLGVPAPLVRTHGAVSQEVAESMASRVRTLAGTTYGIAITGVAGPGGGTPQKPVGTVFVGLAGPDGVEARGYRFGGQRGEIRALAVEVALDWLRRTLLARGG
ncbi:MAG TPA: nicotinamide-nucleotide amidohydrolase family protein [Thermodesulfobacteriota bacterium]